MGFGLSSVFDIVHRVKVIYKHKGKSGIKELELSQALKSHDIQMSMQTLERSCRRSTDFKAGYVDQC